NRAQLGNPNTSFVVNPPAGVPATDFNFCAINPERCTVDSNFGRITAPLNRNFGTGTNRQMQFMLRVNF
ncbi:MAG TPA: hypothetical protein VG324_11945, partial [Blastocatellia bacterium]|nr:hypothetical protein [Blastocatellia bacterium]